MIISTSKHKEDVTSFMNKEQSYITSGYVRYKVNGEAKCLVTGFYSSPRQMASETIPKLVIPFLLINRIVDATNL